METVFLSFSSADILVSRRVYRDLERSGFDVWSYEIDAKLGDHFVDEYEREIARRSYFLLLDSPSARKSVHVQRECDLAQKRRKLDPAFRIVPCPVVETSSAWNQVGPLLENQSCIQHVLLASDAYDRGLARLCRYLGNRDFVPTFRFPEDNEFVRELTDSGLRVPAEAYDQVMDLYRRFRKVADTPDPRAALALLDSVIVVLDSLKSKPDPVPIGTPWIARGLIYTCQNNLTAAVASFDEATLRSPLNPRAFAASGGAHMAIGNYTKAYDAYVHCDRLLVPGHRDRDNLPIVVFGMAQAQLRLNAPANAARILDTRWEEVGTSFFCEDDVIDVATFADRLNDTTNPISPYLMGRFGPRLRLLLGEFAELRAPTVDLPAELVDELNRIVRGPSIYAGGRFAAVSLSNETCARLQPEFGQIDTIRLNRLLLQDAYPEDLKPSFTLGQHGHIIELRARLHLQAGRHADAIRLLEAALRYFARTSSSPPVDVLLTLGNAYRRAGRAADERKIFQTAMCQFEQDPDSVHLDYLLGGSQRLPLKFLARAVEVVPDSVVYRAEFASLLHANGRKEEAKKQAEVCLLFERRSQRSPTPLERYYLGLASHILGKHELASYFRQLADDNDDVVSRWPNYKDLLSS